MRRHGVMPFVRPATKAAAVIRRSVQQTMPTSAPLKGLLRVPPVSLEGARCAAMRLHAVQSTTIMPSDIMPMTSMRLFHDGEGRSGHGNAAPPTSTAPPDTQQEPSSRDAGAEAKDPPQPARQQGGDASPDAAGSAPRQLTPCDRSREELIKLLEDYIDGRGKPIDGFGRVFYNLAFPEANAMTKQLAEKFRTDNTDIKHRCADCGCTVKEHDTQEIVELRKKEAEKARAAAVKARAEADEKARAAADKARAEADEKARAAMERAAQLDALVVQLKEELVLKPELRRKPKRLTDPSIANVEFLGRTREIDAAMRAIDLVGYVKEACRPIIIYSAPRQGKSRLMDEIGMRCMSKYGAEGIFVVALSYNGSENLSAGAKDVQVKGFASRFFARMLLASVGLVTHSEADDQTAAHPVLETLTMLEFNALLRRVHDLKKQRIVLLADEFSKCYLRAAASTLKRRDDGKYDVDEALKAEISQIYSFISGSGTVLGNKIVVSGFSEEARDVLQSASGRPVVAISFPLIDATSRHIYRPMYDTLLAHYGKAKFPIMMYEVVKSCVGLLGFWIEEATTKQLPERVEELATPWRDDVMKKAAVFSKVAESYLEHWARGGSTNAFVETWSAKFNLVDAGSSVMFLPLDFDHVAHPYPFYLLARMSSTKTILLSHLRRIFFIIECDGQSDRMAKDRGVAEVAQRNRKDANVDGEIELQVADKRRLKIRRKRVGEVLEQVTGAMLLMRLAGLGCGKSAMRPWFEFWCVTHRSMPDSLLVASRNAPKVPDDVCLPRTGPITINSSDEADLPATGSRCASVLLENDVVFPPEGNPGFDVAAVLNGEDGDRKGLVLVVVETKKQGAALLCADTSAKYSVNRAGLRFDIGSATRHGTEYQQSNAARFTATRKAWLTLTNIERTLPHLKDASGKKLDIMHIAFISVFAGNVRATYELERSFEATRIGSKSFTIDLKAVIDTLKKSSTTVSLHSVAGREQLEKFLCGPVYHSIPDGEWYVGKGAPKHHRLERSTGTAGPHAAGIAPPDCERSSPPSPISS